MSFTEELITKLSHSFPENTCCRLSLLSAIVKIDGSIHLAKDSPVSLELRISNIALARQVSRQFKSLFGLTGHINLRKLNLQGITQSQLLISKNNQLAASLKKLEILDKNKLNFGLPKSLLKRRCCKRSFLKGTFLAGGYVSEISKNAQAEIYSQNLNLITELSKMLYNKMLLKNKVWSKKNYHYLYLRGHDDVAAFLKLIEASEEALEFENAHVIRHLKNKANRLANAEAANTTKVIKNAFRQIKEINKIDSALGLSSLPKGLQEICVARLQNPEASLAELGEKMSPQLAKSAVNHRFRRIRRIARQLS